MRIHLDTDLGGDTDDACALAMLLGWSGAELVGVTTSIDPAGRRAGCVAHLLELAGRQDVPVVAGAEVSLTKREALEPSIHDPRQWPSGLAARPSSPGAALDALQRSIDGGATLVAIGPYTNLALLEMVRPGALSDASVVVMGGWLVPPGDGLPAWGPDRDSNVQWDTLAAEVVVAASGQLTLVTLPASMKACLRTAQLPRLSAAGPVGELLARQAEAYAEAYAMDALGAAYDLLPDDLLNFQYDPVACAVALGWRGAVVEEQRLRTVVDGELLRFQRHADGRPVNVVTDVDGPAFEEMWLATVERLTARVTVRMPTVPGFD